MQNYYNEDSGALRKELMHDVCEFFQEHGDAALNASSLLGGDHAHRRCLALLALIAETNRLTHHIRVELMCLHKLLMLDCVGDPGAIETWLFMDISPQDPLVGDLCLLADQLQDLLAGLEPLMCAQARMLIATFARQKAA